MRQKIFYALFSDLWPASHGLIKMLVLVGARHKATEKFVNCLYKPLFLHFNVLRFRPCSQWFWMEFNFVENNFTMGSSTIFFLKQNDMQTEVDSYLAFSSLSIPNSSHQSSTNTYVPHNKEWLKEKIYGMLKRQANSK